MKWSVRDESLHSRKMGCKLFRHMCNEVYLTLKMSAKESIYAAATINVTMLEDEIY